MYLPVIASPAGFRQWLRKPVILLETQTLACPAWKIQSSDEEIKAYEDSFAPYDEVMLNGEVITSNASNSPTMRGTISGVKYKVKLYSCRGNIDLAGNSRGTCKNKL